MGDFVTNIVAALDVFNADWETWVVGAIAVGAMLKVGPRLVKRFL